MMTVPMDSSCAPSSRELAQSLYKKNVELENGLRKSAQSRIPSDPNTWFQMRENYEVIILEDHDFSEKHEMEFALWQLHYRRIEEFRARINATASAGSAASQSGKIISRPDSIKKIRSVFKGFLSEATGFYHDLILKIRARYGLPLGYFSEGVENQTTSTKDGKKSAETKKGMVSCHRCLIYLGDLARYKGLYGEGDSISRDYAAATSYYLQAASLWPSSGNPHHQLAILASYSGDELGAVYRYFRSLAVDSPFSTARDNLVIAFEKNRQSYSQLSGNVKVASDKTLHTQSTGSERGTVRGDPRHQVKDSKTETIPTKERDRSFPEMLKTFSTRFVRFNGILFTRTSLESFNEIFSSAISDLHELLSSGPEEVLNFGQDASHCALVLVRLIMVLIFSVHNVKRDAEGQSYAEILQRTMLLQNAFTAAYEFAGYIFKRCTELHDSTSSYLLPAILIFIEWLACNPDVTTSFDLEEKQSTARSFFWNQLVSFLNKLMLSGIVSSNGNEDDNCFVDMGRYEEGETSNRVALWEDFELRGFSPLVAAHLILDFSRKHSLGSVRSTMEKKTRVQRILAAGRALMAVVRIDQKGIYFDQNMKKFVIGLKPHASEPQPGTIKLELAASKVQLHVEGEEEEEIVFKPIATENYYSKSTACEIIQPVQAPSQMLPSQLLVEQQPVLSARIGGNGLLDKHWLQPGLGHVQPMVFSSLVSAPSEMRALEPVIPSKLDYVMHSGPISDGPTMKPLAAVPMAPRKNPVSRPTRHLGPPPGFDHVPSKLMDGDYRWRDGHQPVASKGMVMTYMNHTAPHVSTSKSSNAFDLGTFPFPRKQASAAQYTVDNVNWQDYDPFENFKPFTERDLV